MKRMMAVALACVAASALAQEAPQEQPRRVLAIFAHPDDEIFIAPALANAARQGDEIMLVLATSGDRGPGVSAFEPGEELAEARREEARCSATALGLAGTTFLDYGDGTLGEMPRAAESPARLLTADLTELIKDWQPDLVVTWGPDGGYGHGDHRMVHALVTQVVQSMAEGRPALVYPGIPKGTLPPIPQMQDWAETDPALLPIRHEYGDADLAASRAAIDCHATQFDEASRAQIADLFHATIWQGAVHFRAAFPASPRAVEK
ncbi:PIG-L deacetylase family protein [Qipengyuania vesicularis]|uniref:PIG-L deacetylase family protein n=1 Tax=Qipengyuania vesicularis TaxID=2867232 RepID=UPI001C872145|nr:PIG-L family deacetylase [Qipengyuania vesicularis]MBX7528061.1 PIG-L family deacetylase [Qipengyuania vesicularis]